MPFTQYPKHYVFLTVSNVLLWNSEGPLNTLIPCAVNMRVLSSKLKGSCGTNATSPESKVQAMHFLRESLHLGTGGWQKRREKPGFFKRKYGRDS